jgi:serine/threonine protein kinase/uncharacterized protein YjdB
MDSQMTVCRDCGTSILSEARFCWSCGSPQGQATASTPRLTSRRGDDLLARLRDATAGEYEVRAEIGRGAMAAVFLGQDLSLNRPVAIKVMLSGSYFTDDMPDRFRLEARTAAKLDHPNIVKVYAVKEVDGLLLFVMNFVEGRALSEILYPGEALDVSVVQLVVSQVARALGYAHEEGVVHRDVKPGNILVDRRGSAVVADFGIAKVAEAPELTMTGVVIGTPAYISPEQVLGRPAAPASDQYSLGVVAYRMLAGTMPFGGSALEMQWGHAKERAPEITRPDCPPELRAALMRMLEKDPAHRWPSMADVWREFSYGLTPAIEEQARRQLVELVKRMPPPRDPAAGSRSSAHAAVGSSGRSLPGTGPAPEMPDASGWKLRAIAPMETVLRVGEEILLDAQFAGTPAGATIAPTLAWRSSDLSVATITAGGTVRALSPGTATLRAVMGGVESSIVVTVVPPAGSSEIARLIAEGEFTDRELELADSELADDGVPGQRRRRRRRRWAALIPVLALGLLGAGAWGAWERGMLRPSELGRLRLSERQLDAALSRDTMAGALVSGASVRLAAARDTLEVGDTLVLRATVLDAGGAPLPAREVAWASSDSSVAGVDPDGRVLARAPGRATLPATADGRRDSTTLTVSPVAVAELSVSEAPERVRAGTRFQLTATPLDQRGRMIDRDVAWHSSNERVARVSERGTVVAEASGEVRITARAGDVERGILVRVAPAPVEATRPVAAATRPAAVAQEPPAAEVDPPPEELNELVPKFRMARYHTASSDYRTAADTLRSLKRALDSLAPRYPNSPAVKARLREYAAAMGENRRLCVAEARLARQQGESVPVCP